MPCLSIRTGKTRVAPSSRHSSASKYYVDDDDPEAMPYKNPLPQIEWRRGDTDNTPVTITQNGETFTTEVYYMLETTPHGADRPLVVLIHGMTQSQQRWQWTKHALRGLVDMLSLDLPGCGYTFAHEKFDFSGPSHVKIVRGVLENLNLEKRPLIFVGFSLGGALSTLYTEEYPGNVVAFVPIGPPGMLGPGLFKWARGAASVSLKLLSVGVKTRHRYMRSADFHQSPEMIDWCQDWQDAAKEHGNDPHKTFLQCTLNFPLHGLRETIYNVAADSKIRGRKVLLVWGEYDKTCTLKQSFSAWADAFGLDPTSYGSSSGYGARSYIFRDAAHCAHLETHTRAPFAKLLREFVEDVVNGFQHEQGSG